MIVVKIIIVLIMVMDTHKHGSFYSRVVVLDHHNTEKETKETEGVSYIIIKEHRDRNREVF